MCSVALRKQAGSRHPEIESASMLCYQVSLKSLQMSQPNWANNWANPTGPTTGPTGPRLRAEALGCKIRLGQERRRTKQKEGESSLMPFGCHHFPTPQHVRRSFSLHTLNLHYFCNIEAARMLRTPMPPLVRAPASSQWRASSQKWPRAHTLTRTPYLTPRICIG